MGDSLDTPHLAPLPSGNSPPPPYHPGERLDSALVQHQGQTLNWRPSRPTPTHPPTPYLAHFPSPAPSRGLRQLSTHHLKWG